jgi:hypothetical protein
VSGRNEGGKNSKTRHARTHGAAGADAELIYPLIAQRNSANRSVRLEKLHSYPNGSAKRCDPVIYARLEAGRR